MRKHLDSTELAQIQLCVGTNLRMTTRVITQMYDDALRPVGLRVTQYPILAALSKSRDVTISDLADELVLDRTTVTRNLKPLESQGFVRISAGGDRRTRMIVLTQKGKNALKKAFPLWRNVQNDLLKKFGKRNWRNLRRDLSRLAHSAH